MACKRLEILPWLTPNALPIVLGFDLNFRPAMPAILHL